MPRETVLAQKLSTRPPRRTPLPQLDDIAANFAAAMERSARTLFRSTVGAIITRTDIRPLTRVAEDVPIPAMLGIAPMPGMQSAAMVNVSSDLVYHIVDLRMGGDPQQAPVPTARTFTAIDMALSEAFVAAAIECFLSAIETALGAPLERRMALSHLEQNITQVRLAANNADVLVIAMNLDIGEAARNADFELVIPLAVLDALQASRGDDSAQQRDQHADLWRSHMRRVARETEVDVSAVLHRMNVPVRELEGWEPGTLLEFPRSTLEELELTIGEPSSSIALGTARLGASGGRKMVKLTTDMLPEMQTYLTQNL